MDSIMKQYDLTGWLLNQINMYSYRLKKDDIELYVKTITTENGPTTVVDIYEYNQFMTSRDSLQEAFDFIEGL